MSTIFGPNIVRDGLVFDLEAGSVRSYPGSGTEWYDLVGKDSNWNHHTASFVGSPTFQDMGSKTAINFSSATSDYATTTFDEGILKKTNQTGAWSIEVAFKLVGTPTSTECLIAGRLGCNGGIYLYSNLSLYHAVKTNVCWTGYSFTTSVLSIGNWYHSVMTYNNGIIKSYLNGLYTGTSTLDLNTYDMSAYSDTFYIGGIGGRYTNIDLSLVRCYNTELSVDQVTQNYNTVKQRFNI